MTKDLNGGKPRELQLGVYYRKMDSWRVSKKLKKNYDLDKHEFCRYLQLRNYYRKEIKMDPSREVNGLVQITVKAYKGNQIRTISELYGYIIKNRHSTKYIKKKKGIRI